MNEESSNSSNFPILVTTALVIMLLFTFRSIHELKNNQNKIKDITKKISKFSDENLKLREKIIYAQSEGFIKKNAIENLRLTKDGYEIVIVNDKQVLSASDDTLNVEGLDIIKEHEKPVEHTVSLKDKLLKLLHLR